MAGSKFPTKQFSKPARFPMPKRSSSENTTPMEDLTTTVTKQEAKINDLKLRLDKMDQRIKDIEAALIGEDAIDHSAKVLEDALWEKVDDNTDTAQKNQKSADALRKQKNMYRALGINPASSGL
ncbi:hypothetical protein NHQ30_009322 [Ciborinia camelliae]|nr:hypothetical protein NHQ30_009322 [Ciborinia camelliae]